MNDENVLRLKSAMIIYSLETALGNYIVKSQENANIKDESVNTIAEREKERGNEIDTKDISMLVEASYLDEVFNLAINTTNGTSYFEKMKALKSLCSYMNIFDIRNAISHPNRPFPDTYWFRSAAIGSDPLILQLGLNEVRQSLNSALEGNLTSPPDEWLNNVKWAIPNSLPTSFDHEITGLLGRDKEFRELEKTLSKVRNNLIAVVAPGGIGKTALILQFLRDISLNPNWSRKIDSILFCSLKNERLTADGIELIEAINGIDQIKDSILNDLRFIYTEHEFNTFEEACDLLQDEHVLICIDNLETLLINSQKEFIDFNQSLPIFWRVIVTSRISIDSATTVPIQALGKRHAVHLSRSYFKKRGVSDFKQEDLEMIASKANNNPLAIRLTIDLYNRGIDISQSISQSQKDIASFSYSNLIESLKENSIAILETIFVTGDCNKSQLVELLDHSNEEISEAINELSKTSLIVRSTSESGNDRFQLSDSIRDLLLTNPKNIEVRSRISQSLKERNIRIQEQISRNQQLGITTFDEEFITENVESSIHVAVVDLNKYLSKPPQKRSHSELVRLKSRFSDLIAYNTNNAELFYHFSRVLKSLKDSPSEFQILDKALRMDEGNPRYLKAKALNFFYGGEYKEANEIFKKLIGHNYDNPEISSRKFSSSLKKLNLLCHLFQGEYDEILDLTKDWKSDKFWSVMMGTYRASALRRSVEKSNNSDGEREEAYKKTLKILLDMFLNGDYPALACIEGIKITRDIGTVFSYKNYYSDEFLYEYVKFIADHFFSMVSVVRGESIESNENKTFLDKVYSHSFNNIENPLNNVSWYSPDKEIFYDQDHIEELKEEDYKIVTVYKIPETNFGMPSYLFAKDDTNNEYYLNVDKFETGWNRWGYIKMNDKLAIKFKENSVKGANPALEIVEVDKYEM